MRVVVFLLPLLACTDKGEEMVDDAPESNMELPTSIGEFFSDNTYSGDIGEAAYSDVSCSEDTGWTLSTNVDATMDAVRAFWWDLRTGEIGHAQDLADGGSGIWSATVDATVFGRDCTDGSVLVIVVPIVGGDPGDADVVQYIDGGNAIDGAGFSSTDTTGSLSVNTEAGVDDVFVHVINPWIPYYWGPEALTGVSASLWEVELDLQADLGATTFDAVWIGYAALSDGQLVGIGGS